MATKAVLREFSNRLQALMIEKNMSQSDLARAVWGERKDPRTGYMVAKNRDAVSNYLKGVRLPDPRNLSKMAAALAVTTDQLVAGFDEAPLNARTELTMTQLANNPGKVHLEVDKIVPLSVAAKIMELLVEE